MLGRIRRAVFPVCDLVHMEYGPPDGDTYGVFYPRYWLFGLLPVKIGWGTARYRYDLALKLIEMDRMK